MVTLNFPVRYPNANYNLNPDTTLSWYPGYLQLQSLFTTTCNGSQDRELITSKLSNLDLVCEIYGNSSDRKASAWPVASGAFHYALSTVKSLI